MAVDPQSRNNILSGIKKLNKQGVTIIYTTHYMEEVEQLCDRIAILDKGKTVALGTKEELKAMIKIGEKITVEIFNLSPSVIDTIRELSTVDKAEYRENTLVIRSTKGKNNIVRIIEFLNEHNIEFGKIYSELPTLNDVFLEITGKELRD